MKKCTKAVLVLIVAIICEMLFGYGYCGGKTADEYDFNDELFEDVSYTDSCFSAVEYLWSRGIVNIDDGYFHPDENIGSREFLYWVIGCYQPETTMTGFVNWYRSARFSILNELFEENDPICWYQAADIVFNTSGVHLYDGDSYSKDSKLYGMTDGQMVMYLANSLGFCRKNTKTTDLISRAEAASLIFGCMDCSIESELPELLKDFPIEIEGSVNMELVLEQFELVPEVVLDEFVKRDWTFIVSREYMDQFNKEAYPDGSFAAGGICRHNQKIIAVDGYHPVCHELGHFVDKQTTKGDTVEVLFEKEGAAAAEEIREYARTNSGEFFADFFAQYLSRNRSGKTALRKACPETYQYFVELEANNWGF